MKSRQEGFVLVSVLWILALLTVIALGFGHRALMERRLATYSLNQTQALHMARGAAQRAIAELRNRDFLQFYGGGALPGSYRLKWRREINLLEKGNYFALGKDRDYAHEKANYTIEDTGGRLNLNYAPEELLREVKGLSKKSIRAIIRRRSRGGRGGSPAPFAALEELRSVAGIGDTEWYGERGNPGLRDVLGAWGGHGNGLIDVNAAPRVVLELIPKLSRGVVDAILEYRAGGDGQLGTSQDVYFRSIDDMVRLLNIKEKDGAILGRFCTVFSNLFIVTGYGTRRTSAEGERPGVVAYCRALVRMQGTNALILQWKEGSLGA